MLRTTKFSLIGLVLALGVVGCVGRVPKPTLNATPSPLVVSTPTPTVSPVSEETAVEIITSTIDTSDWLTYRNEEYRFEVHYPKGWNVWKAPMGSQISFSPWKMHGDAPMISVVSSKDINNKVKSYKERVEIEANGWEWESFGKKIFEKQEVILISQKIIQYRSTSKNNLERVTFFVGKDFVYGMAFKPAGEIPLETYNAMLLSFRVIGDADALKAKIITSDIDTSDWLTYQSMESEFSVRYPKGWYTKEWYSRAGIKMMHFSPTPIGPNNDYGIYIDIRQKTREDLEYRESVIDIYKSWGYAPVQLKEVVISGKRILQSSEVNYFFESGPRIIHFSFIPAGEIPITIYNAMLLSFRVIDDADALKAKIITSDLDTSDWLTYRNKQYGFLVRYPQGWSVREHKTGELKYDPTPDNLLTEFFDNSDESKFFIAIPPKKNDQKVRVNEKPIRVNGMLMYFQENNTGMHAVSYDNQYITTFNGIKPNITREVFNAILLTWQYY